MPLFFTLPPPEVPYPYVLVNANRPEPGLRYLARHRGVVEAVIIDSGVEMFRGCNRKEYPGGPRGWMERLASLFRRVRALVPGVEIVATVPDYPDDYCHGALWVGGMTNVERTAANVGLAIALFPDIDWLVPVQGFNEEPRSIVRGLEAVERAGGLEYAASLCRRTKLVPCLALANLCVSKSCRTIRETVRLARLWLGTRYPSLRLHVFGPAASCVSKIRGMVHSWDSLAWTRPRDPHGSSARNSQERVFLFLTFLHRYSQIIDLPGLPLSMRKRLGVMH